MSFLGKLLGKSSTDGPGKVPADAPEPVKSKPAPGEKPKLAVIRKGDAFELNGIPYFVAEMNAQGWLIMKPRAKKESTAAMMTRLQAKG